MALKRFFSGLFIVLICSTSAWAQANEEISVEKARELYYQGYCAYQTDDFQSACRIFYSIKDKYPQLGDYVLYYLAQSQAHIFNFVAAAENWERLIKLYPYSRLIKPARLGLAEARLKQGCFIEAAKLYEDLIAEGINGQEDAGRAYLNLGIAYECLNQPKKAADIYQELWAGYPNVSSIPSANERMEYLEEKYGWTLPQRDEEHLWKRIKGMKKAKKYELTIKLTELFIENFPDSELLPKIYLIQGNCYLDMGRRENSLPSFRAILINYPECDQAATALYTISKIYWNMNDSAAAIKDLTYLVENYPHSSWVDEALFLLGRLHEENDAIPRAFKAYDRLIRNFPYSPWAAQAAWHNGWIHYRLGYYLKAINSFEKINKRMNFSPWAEACIYWKGRSFENLGRLKNAIDTYNELINNAGFTYYAQLAEKRLPRLVANYKCSYSEMACNLIFKNPVIPAKRPKMAFHFERVLELAELGIYDAMKKEIACIPVSSITDYNLLMYFSQAYRMAGDYRQSIQILWDYLNAKKIKIKDTPLEIRYQLFPRYYWENLEDQGKLHNVDPYLIAALIRRESVFEPSATSGVGAVGLMQLMPITAMGIAQEMKIKGLTKEDLYAPDINIRYGSYYLAQLLKRFESTLPLALSAYNAGEKAAQRWQKTLLEQNSENPDWEEYVENITYAETRNYVRQVISNYNNYLLLYKGPEHVFVNPN